MNLETKVMEALKEAMKSKDQAALRGVRAIKSAILLFKTDGTHQDLDDAAELKILQKLVKQRQDSIEIFLNQNRPDLAKVEQEEVEVIMKFLPEQLSPEALEKAMRSIAEEIGATNAKDMGKLIAAANQKLAGQADGKSIAAAAKSILS